MSLSRIVYAEVTVLDLVVVAGVMAASILASKLAAMYLRRSLKERMTKDHMESIVKITSFSIVAVSFLAVVARLGFNLSGLLVAGGIAGIVIGFASQSIVGNLISGLFLMFERPIKIGDIVDIDGYAGTVEDINIISTSIRKFDGLFIRIPNEKVFTTSITNFVSHAARRFEYVVGIRYSDDADRAIGIIKEVVGAQPFALKEPALQAFVDNLGDNSVNIIVRIWAPVPVWYDLKMELLWKIKATLEKRGIEIAFPQRVVWFGDTPEGTELKITKEDKERNRP
ncbi:MAG: mechanosensitive ion channel family protein [bacterium]